MGKIVERLNEEEVVSKYLGTSYILNHKADFEPGRTSDFILKIMFQRDLYDMDGNFVCTADEATENLALSLKDYSGPEVKVDKLTVKTGNGQVSYAGTPSISDSSISFTDYIGAKTEQILLAWYSMAHNIKNDKIGFKEYYAQDGILYKWAPNGTRQISWKLLGCWIDSYNVGQFSRENPQLRSFSTSIVYDKAIPFATPTYKQWNVTKDEIANQQTSRAFNDHTTTNYLGTLNSTEKK